MLLAFHFNAVALVFQYLFHQVQAHAGSFHLGMKAAKHGKDLTFLVIRNAKAIVRILRSLEKVYEEENITAG